jgi:hypothetical protein
MPWQLKQLSTDHVIEEATTLPTNWGPIFGLANFKDRLSDLSWVSLPDQGWFEVSPDVSTEEELTAAEIATEDRNQRLAESDWTMLSDVPMTSGKKAEWISYRSTLRDITLQPDFPNSIVWPTKPV